MSTQLNVSEKSILFLINELIGSIGDSSDIDNDLIDLLIAEVREIKKLSELSDDPSIFTKTFSSLSSRTQEAIDKRLAPRDSDSLANKEELFGPETVIDMAEKVHKDPIDALLDKILQLKWCVIRKKIDSLDDSLQDKIYERMKALLNTPLSFVSIKARKILSEKHELEQRIKANLREAIECEVAKDLNNRRYDAKIIGYEFAAHDRRYIEDCFEILRSGNRASLLEHITRPLDESEKPSEMFLKLAEVLTWLEIQASFDDLKEVVDLLIEDLEFQEQCIKILHLEYHKIIIALAILASTKPPDYCKQLILAIHINRTQIGPTSIFACHPCNPSKVKILEALDSSPDSEKLTHLLDPHLDHENLEMVAKVVTLLKQKLL